MKEEDDNMLIFKIVCIIMLVTFIVTFALGTYSISRGVKNNQYDDDNEVSYAKHLVKLGWALLICTGAILIYVIMN